MWKDIKNYESCYEINEFGQVRSKRRTIIAKTGQTYEISERILKPNITKNGYKLVHLCKNGVRKAEYVHILVAKAFLPNDSDSLIINHINGNKKDCSLSNLEWCTYSANNQHAYDTGLKPKGEGQYKAKLSQADVIQIRAEGKHSTYQEIASRYGVSKATIRDVLLFRTWR